jgi:hypothetical protein
MTQKRWDEHSTEFGLWLRERKEIDSSLGYVATNVDYMWRNYKTGKWMLIEEKRFMAKVKRWQQEMFKLLTWCAKHHPRFRGFHVIQFEKTSPQDGKIFLDGTEISEHDLIEFLKMERP